MQICINKKKTFVLLKQVFDYLKNCLNLSFYFKGIEGCPKTLTNFQKLPVWLEKLKNGLKPDKKSSKRLPFWPGPYA